MKINVFHLVWGLNELFFGTSLAEFFNEIPCGLTSCLHQDDQVKLENIDPTDKIPWGTPHLTF